MNYWAGPGVGIGPARILYLFEGSRAAWVLQTALGYQSPQAVSRLVWVASRPERILADGLVMVAALVEQDADIRKAIEQALEPKQAQKLLEADWSDDLDAIADEALEVIETAAQQSVSSKLVVSVLNGSSIAGQLALLDRCSMDVEVCTPSWTRETNDGGTMHTTGALPPEDPGAHRFTAVRTELPMF